VNLPSGIDPDEAGRKKMKQVWAKEMAFGLAIFTILLQTSCTGLIAGGALVGGGVAGYYAHEKGWLRIEKKEEERKEKEKEEPAAMPKKTPEEEKKVKREIGCVLPF